MKPNWHIVGYVVVGIVALVGWGLFWRQRNVSEELLSKVPTPPPVVLENRILGNFQRFEGGMLTVGVRAPNGDGTTLESRTLPVSPGVTVVQFDPETNDYSGQAIESFEVGVWLMIDTDDSGTVIAITAGR